MQQAGDEALPLQTFIRDRYKAGGYGVLYSGASGLVMKASHRLMERGIAPVQNARVLEIGGGAMPHLGWMNASEMKSYTVSDEIELHRERLDALKEKMPPQIQLDLHDFEADPSFGSLPGNYTRIIASHVLEHIPDPERAIRKWSSLLSDDGILSIAIPCDPGWLWRLGQYAAYRGYKIGLSFEEYDLLMAREHINSVQRLLKLLRYYYAQQSIRWFPSALPVADLNLVCLINVRKSAARRLLQS